MMLTRTPSCHQSHDYNLKLTEGEVIALSSIAEADFMGPEWKLHDRFIELMTKEAKRLNDLRVQQ